MLTSSYIVLNYSDSSESSNYTISSLKHSHSHKIKHSPSPLHDYKHSFN